MGRGGVIKLSRALAIGALMGAVVASPSIAEGDHADPYHWSRNYPTVTAVAQVYFLDNTGDRWPVLSSGVQQWDARPNYFRPYYAPSNCNPDLVHCVPVFEVNYPAVRWYGRTVFSVRHDGSNHIIHGSMTVRLNNGKVTTLPGRRETVCHELGHATGPLDEGNDKFGSCMWKKYGQPFLQVPSAHDLNVIVSTYDH